MHGTGIIKSKSADYKKAIGIGIIIFMLFSAILYLIPQYARSVVSNNAILSRFVNLNGLALGFPFPFLNINTNEFSYLMFALDIVIWGLVSYFVYNIVIESNAAKGLSHLKRDYKDVFTIRNKKHAIIGIGLILYAMFLTPAYFEPSDLAISTGWIAFALAFFPHNALWILPIWMWTGYVAVMLGIWFIGKRLLNKFGYIGEEMYSHPYTGIALISIIAAILVIIIFNSTMPNALNLW